MVNTDTPQRTRSSSVTQAKPKVLRPFNTAEVKILLLENVNETAVKSFQKQGYQVSLFNRTVGRLAPTK
jgi:D-3-phosphoglycerate dehydrogenase